jgi:hypothetical protein
MVLETARPRGDCGLRKQAGRPSGYGGTLFLRRAGPGCAQPQGPPRISASGTLRRLGPPRTATIPSFGAAWPRGRGEVHRSASGTAGLGLYRPRARNPSRSTCRPAARRRRTRDRDVIRRPGVTRSCAERSGPSTLLRPAFRPESHRAGSPVCVRGMFCTPRRAVGGSLPLANRDGRSSAIRYLPAPQACRVHAFLPSVMRHFGISALLMVRPDIGRGKPWVLQATLRWAAMVMARTCLFVMGRACRTPPYMLWSDNRG